MTKPLDPDIKAARALTRAINGLPNDTARTRVLEWLLAYYMNVSWFKLPRPLRESPEQEQ